MKNISRAGAALLTLSAACAGHAAPGPSLEAIEQTYIDQDAAAYPVGATASGLHEGDKLIDDVSPAAHSAEIARLHATLDQLAHLDAKKLTDRQRDDREILAAEIGGQLLEEEHVRNWRKNPDVYVGLATQAAYTLIARDFAPARQRLEAVVARERQIPKLFAAAKQNLADMPPVFVEIGLENVAGAIDFLGHDVTAAFTGLDDKGAQTELDAATQQAVAAARDFQTWLLAKKPTSTGSFVLGTENFSRLLEADMIDLTPEQVLAAGRTQLQRDQTDFAAASIQVSPKNPADALAVLGRDHPDAAHLIPDAHDTLGSIRQFIVAHKIIDLPSTDLPKVAATPPFQRALIFAEMDWPGPFEKNATQAFYYITPPDMTKSADSQTEYLAYFNHPFLVNLSVHEALPGHFTQFLFSKANPDWSLVRKTGHSYTATEGWAHYSEQMMYEQGVGGGGQSLHLAQLSDALLRDCRLIAAVEMHTHGMTLADAAKMMAKECFQPKDVAYKEARRGTADAEYFSYTLGKLMIQKLREDVQAKEGRQFTLAKFHDRFLSSGLVPIKIIRREMLGKDGPLL
jgi:uncharacterized protein (DUF885 family)